MPNKACLRVRKHRLLECGLRFISSKVMIRSGELEGVHLFSFHL